MLPAPSIVCDDIRCENADSPLSSLAHLKGRRASDFELICIPALLALEFDAYDVSTLL